MRVRKEVFAMSKSKYFVAGWIFGGLVSAAIVSVLNRRKYAIRERGLLMMVEDLEDRCFPPEDRCFPPDNLVELPF